MKLALKIAIPVLVVLALAGGAAWWFLLRDDAPAEASLDNIPSPTTTATGQSGVGAVPATADGTWNVQQGDGVFVGYRVQEQFGGDTVKRTAAGRSPVVSGSFALQGDKVTGARFEVDMTKLQSDSSRRDARMRSSGLQTDTFPTASFALTQPVTLPSAPQLGQPIKVEVAGDLTLHGVTKAVTVQLEARWDGATVAVSGGTLIAMADFGITPPSVGGFVTVDDGGVLELQLLLSEAP